MGVGRVRDVRQHRQVGMGRVDCGQVCEGGSGCGLGVNCIIVQRASEG